MHFHSFHRLSQLGVQSKSIPLLQNRLSGFHTLGALGASRKPAKVAVCGAAGGIGQPLSLLLKGSKYISELRLYDIKGAPGVTADLSHIETPVKVTGFNGIEEIEGCMSGADVVVIPAGLPRKPGMMRDDLFNTNASICADLVDKCAQICPSASICIITNPVNSTVAIASEVLKHRGVFNENKLFGITTLDVVRTNTFVAELKKLDVASVRSTVIAGHSAETIVPLLSQIRPPHVTLTQKEIEQLVNRIQNAGTEVVEAKAGAGSATLSMAYAAARFLNSLLAGLSGEPNVIECTFTASNRGDVAFFSEPHLLGKNGAEKRLGTGKLSKYEESLLEVAMVTLKKSIEKGVSFGKEYVKKL